jgi:WD40 repeat protein/serine/threonine protein kinase
MAIAPRSLSESSPYLAKKLEEEVAAFEIAWLQGKRPAIEVYLAEASVDRMLLLVELVHAELECRLKAGEPARAEEYFQRFPELARETRLALDLVAAEYRLRRRVEPGLSVDVYRLRFPEMAPDLHLRMLGELPGGGSLAPNQLGGPLPGSSPPPPDSETPSGWGRADAVNPTPPLAFTPLPDIPGYEVLAEIGRGGMGVIYKARQPQLNRLVALKMIRVGSTAGTEEVDRFRNEAVAVARLHHPNIVQIYDIGQHNGLPYFSMELVEGPSLDRQLAGTPVRANEAAALVETLARSIHYAHERGIVHRDLKPANILLVSGVAVTRGSSQSPPAARPSAQSIPPPLTAYQPKITDFGLAKHLEADSGQTPSGAVMGTPSYMAPEQAGGRSRAIGPTADVYALGAILYECLTGRPPFRAATILDTIQQVLFQDPVPPSRLEPKVPYDLELICLKCLQKEPGKRYSSAAQLAGELRRYQSGVPLAFTRAVHPVERWWRWCRRNPLPAGLLVGLFLAIGSGFAGIAWKWQEALDQADAEQSARELAQAQRLKATEAARQAERQTRKLERALYLNNIVVADHEWLDNHVGRADEILQNCLPKAGGPDLRSWEWYYLKRRCHTQIVTLRGDAQHVAYSPDGKRLATANGRKVTVWDTARWRALWTRAGHTKAVSCLAFSPDGRRLASGSGDPGQRTAGEIIVWDARDGAKKIVFRGHSKHITGVVFGPQGRWLASADEDEAVRVWDAASGKKALSLEGGRGGASSLAISPEGRHLAAAQVKRILIWETATGRKSASLNGHSEWVGCLAFSPDGKLLASGSQDKTVKIWDLHNQMEILTLAGHGETVTDVAFSPDSQWLVTASYDRTVRVWYRGLEPLVFRGASSCVTFCPDGRHFATASFDDAVKIWDAFQVQEVLTLAGHQSSVYSVAFSPDSRRLASASNSTGVKIWDVSSGRESLTLNGVQLIVTSVVYRKDGRQLASGSWDGTVVVWDAATGKATRILKAESGPTMFQCVAFHPDGRYIAAAANTPGGARSRQQVGSFHIWDTATGKKVRTISVDPNTATAVAYSPNGKLLACAGFQDGTVKILDANTGKVIRCLQGHSNVVKCLAFDFDGQRLATGGDDQTVQIWDLTTGKSLAALREHNAAVASVAFSPNGRRLFSAGWDGTVRVWDPFSGRQVHFLKAHREPARGVAISPDGHYLASASHDGKVKIWDGRPLKPK